jgi:hypothetical protein
MPARVFLAIALVAPLLIGSLEALVFVRTIFKPGMLDAPIAVGFGLLGISSIPVSAWALLKVRSQHLWKLLALLLISTVLAALGWVYVIGVAHG